jgi:hypothetical protein
VAAAAELQQMSFATRLESFSQSWPPSIRRELRRYTQRTCNRIHRSDNQTGTASSKPYWLLLPSLLACGYNRRKRRTISRRTLDEILWAQYCLFLSLRIKDDLFDGQSISSMLFFAADQLLTEAAVVLFRHFDHSHGFWRTYSECLQETIEAFWEVDSMQRRRRVSFKQWRDAHARVCSVFKVGSAAVCHLADHRYDYWLLGEAADHLAIAGQALDDLWDMNEDIQQGRLNYAARFILGSNSRLAASDDEVTGLLATRLLHSNRVVRLIDEIRRRVLEAQRVLEPLGLPESDDYFSQYERSLIVLKDTLGRERVRQLFNSTNTVCLNNKARRRSRSSSNIIRRDRQ